MVSGKGQRGRTIVGMQWGGPIKKSCWQRFRNNSTVGKNVKGGKKKKSLKAQLGGNSPAPWKRLGAAGETTVQRVDKV